jgi:hypothetical protein
MNNISESSQSGFVTDCIHILLYMVEQAKAQLKGTVSRDFRPSVSFVKQYPLGP